MIGEQILSYKIESLLGSGGVGSVYLASHTQLGRKVAIKVLNPTLVNHNEVKDRFRNEASTLSNLQHVNIVTLYDYLENNTGLFLIMEYAKGKALDDYISQVSGPIPEQKTIFFFNKILDGMAYAHQQDVVHRDIKPSNIIITEDGNVKILDFGIAKILKSKQDMTKAGAQLGTVLYMSPEQVKGEQIDPRSDIYSLGVTLFEMLTGKCPYDENQNTEFEVYNKIINQDLPRAKSFYPAVSDKMQAIIDKATHKDPAQRFQSCEAFKQALNSTIVERKKTSSTTPKRTTKLKPKKTGSSRILYAVLLVVILGLIAIIAFDMFSGGNKPISSGKIDDIPLPEDEEDLTDEYEKNKEEAEEEEEATPEQLRLDSLKSYRKKLQKTLEEAIKSRRKDLLSGLVVDVQIVDQSLGETTVRLKVSNTREDTEYENVEVAVLFLDANGEELKNYKKVYGIIKAQGEKEENITVEVDAEGISKKLIDANPKGSAPFELKDSLTKEIEEVQEKIIELQDELSDIGDDDS